MGFVLTPGSVRTEVLDTQFMLDCCLLVWKKHLVSEKKTLLVFSPKSRIVQRQSVSTKILPLPGACVCVHVRVRAWAHMLSGAMWGSRETTRQAGSGAYSLQFRVVVVKLVQGQDRTVPDPG